MISKYLGGLEGTGKNAFAELLMKACSDGDLATKTKDVQYSTSIREIVTIEDMFNHSLLRGDYLV